MPPLPGTAPDSPPSMVPVINNSPRKLNKGKAPARHPPRRQYNDEPLPVKPNATAPKNARIVGRKQAHDGGLVSYHLKIGEVDIDDVGVDEILDYVSALELEQFEIQRFREEGEILKALEDDREAARKAKLARAVERARTKGAVFVAEGSDDDEFAAFAETERPTNVPVGKHGRARPDYSRFYKLPQGKGKGVFRDVDEEMVDETLRTNEKPSASRFDTTHELPKRRRRRRDPVSGELMPLAPLQGPVSNMEKQVRKRRKRHPLTGELMPIGWRYDPEAEGEAYERRRAGLGSGVNNTPFQRLSISEHHEAKRPRLDTESADSKSVSPIPTKAEIMGKAASQSTPRGGALRASIIDLMSSDEEKGMALTTPRARLKHPSRQAGNNMMRGTMGSTATSSAETSPEPGHPTSVTRPTAATSSASQRTPKETQLTTSILSPSAARASSTDPLAVSHNDSSDAEADDDEWLIESILGHRLSDPRTHPPELGKEPVMLYSVKWEGYNEPMWEPLESFGDRSFVDDYREKAGLPPLPRDEGEDEEHDGDEVFELDKIVAHQLSDPSTHPKTLGKTPVMLYQVRWKDWVETTWEPEDSFKDDLDPLVAYKEKHGL